MQTSTATASSDMPPALTIEYTTPDSRPSTFSRLPNSLALLPGTHDGAICINTQTLPLYWGMRLVSTSNRTGCVVQEVAQDDKPIIFVDDSMNKTNPEEKKKILPRGLAAQIAILPGDRVVYINNRYTRGTEEWHWANRMAEEDIRDGLTDKISMQIERKGQRYVIYVPIRH